MRDRVCWLGWTSCESKYVWCFQEAKANVWMRNGGYIPGRCRTHLGHLWSCWSSFNDIWACGSLSLLVAASLSNIKIMFGWRERDSPRALQRQIYPSPDPRKNFLVTRFLVSKIFQLGWFIDLSFLMELLSPAVLTERDAEEPVGMSVPHHSLVTLWTEVHLRM